MVKLWQRATRLLPGRGSGLLRGSGVAFLTSVAGLFISYITNIYLSRLLGAAEFGVYGLAISWAALLMVAASLGLHQAALRLLPLYRTEELWGVFRGYLRQSWWLTLGSGLLIGGSGALLALRFGGGPALILGFALVPLLALLNLQSALLRVQQRIFLAVAPNSLLRFMLLLGGVVVLVRLGAPAEARMVVAVLIVSIAVLVVVQQIVLNRSWAEPARTAPPERRFREWLGVALPLLLTTSSIILLKRTDIIMLGLLTTATDVGFYFAASRVAALTTFALIAVNTIASPMVSSAHARGDAAGLQRLTTSIVMLSFWPSLLVALLLIVFADPILGLFGSEFVAARWPLTILIVGYLMNAAAGAVSILLNMTGHQNVTARIFALALLLNIVLNTLTIPRWGMIGAALSTAVTMAFWNVWLSVLVRRRLGLHTSVLGPLFRLFPPRG